MCKEEESISTVNGKVTKHVRRKEDCHRADCNMSDDYTGPNKHTSKKLGYLAELAEKQYEEMEKRNAEFHKEWEKRWADLQNRRSEDIRRSQKTAAAAHDEHIKAQRDAYWEAAHASHDALTEQLEAQMKATQEAFQAQMDAHVKAAEATRSAHLSHLESQLSAFDAYHMQTSFSSASRHSRKHKTKESRAPEPPLMAPSEPAPEAATPNASTNARSMASSKAGMMD